MITLSDDSTKPFLTIRYVVEDDTFAVVDTPAGKVVREASKPAATLNNSPRRCTQSVALSRDQSADLKDLSAGRGQ